ncbi:uncharacterized protein G2W53_017429 [Senna tora]|uniref:Uncharacterized protein n=1 Tax=Senna tora TaxID=362788 RepID=A0A834WK64_9FABA|nr:uncharacterized protein G2W53_017429 [Senna tora]
MGSAKFGMRVFLLNSRDIMFRQVCTKAGSPWAGIGYSSPSAEWKGKLEEIAPLDKVFVPAKETMIVASETM